VKGQKLTASGSINVEIKTVFGLILEHCSEPFQDLEPALGHLVQNIGVIIEIRKLLRANRTESIGLTNALPDRRCHRRHKPQMTDRWRRIGDAQEALHGLQQ